MSNENNEYNLIVKTKMITKNIQFFIMIGLVVEITILMLLKFLSPTIQTIYIILVGLLLALIYAVIMYYAFIKEELARDQKKEVYKLIFKKDSISSTYDYYRYLDQNTTITIPLKEITSINKYKNGDIIIFAQDSAKSIFIPANVEKRDEIIKKLQEIKQLNEINTKIKPFADLLLIALISLFFISIVFTQNKYYFTILGIIILILLLWPIFHNFRSNLVSKESLNNSIIGAFAWGIGIIFILLLSWHITSPFKYLNKTSATILGLSIAALPAIIFWFYKRIKNK